MTERIDQPQPCFFRCKLIRGGPWVGGRIWLDHSVPERPTIMLAEIDGKPADLQRAWIAAIGNQIDERDYHYHCGVRAWAEQHAPDEPEADPRKPVDWNTLRIKF